MNPKLRQNALSVSMLSQEAQDAVERLCRADCFTILRKGGPRWSYRMVMTCGSLEPIKASYDKIAADLRQGVALLIGPGRELLDLESGPTLRTRW